MDLKNKEQILKQFFESKNINVTKTNLEKMAEIAQEAYFQKNTIILNDGRKQQYVYLIIHGIARSTYLDEDGDDITKIFMQKNEFLIGESLFSDISYESFSAITDLNTLRFEAKALKKIIESDQNLTKFYIEMLEDTIRYKMRREYSFQHYNATKRYEEFLKLYPTLAKKLPQNLIASYLGIKKESLSRIRKNFANS